MRRFLIISSLLLALSLPAFADGNTESPGGVTPTPTPTPTPCTGFCPEGSGTSSAPESDEAEPSALDWLYELIFGA